MVKAKASIPLIWPNLTVSISSKGMYLPVVSVTLMSGLKLLSIPDKILSNPLKTDKIRIKAAVPIAIPTIEIHVMIWMALVDFLPNKYRNAILRYKFMMQKYKFLVVEGIQRDNDYINLVKVILKSYFE